MKRFLIVPALLLAGLCLHAQVITPEHQKRAADLVKQMTLDEKMQKVRRWIWTLVCDTPIRNYGMQEPA